MDRPEWTATNPETGEVYLTPDQQQRLAPPARRHRRGQPAPLQRPQGRRRPVRQPQRPHHPPARERQQSPRPPRFTWDIYLFGARLGRCRPGQRQPLGPVRGQRLLEPRRAVVLAPAERLGQVSPLLWIQTDDGADDRPHQLHDARRAPRLGRRDGGARTITNTSTGGATADPGDHRRRGGHRGDAQALPRRPQGRARSPASTRPRTGARCSSASSTRASSARLPRRAATGRKARAAPPRGRAALGGGRDHPATTAVSSASSRSHPGKRAAGRKCPAGRLPVQRMTSLLATSTLVWMMKSARAVAIHVARDKAVAARAVGSQLPGNAAERARSDPVERVVGTAGDRIDCREVELVPVPGEVEDSVAAADLAATGTSSLPSPPRSWSLPLPPSSRSVCSPPSRTSPPAPPVERVGAVAAGQRVVARTSRRARRCARRRRPCRCRLRR